MKRITRTRLGAFVLLLLLWPAYFFVTELAIKYCVRDISKPTSSCIYLFWNSADETRFLIAMGNRSIPEVTRCLENPVIKLKSRIHLAWVLSCIGDHSHFQIFLDGLASPQRDMQWISFARMRDFPEQCFGHIGDILNIPVTGENDCYWDLITTTALTSGLDSGQRDEIYKIIAPRKQNHEALSADEKNRILGIFHGKP